MDHAFTLTTTGATGSGLVLWCGALARGMAGRVPARFDRPPGRAKAAA